MSNVVGIFCFQASNESSKQKPDNSLDYSLSMDNDCMLLPHERVGGDFSWLQMQSHEDTPAQKADEFEDEESFLYGSEDTREKQATSSSSLFKTFPQRNDSPSYQQHPLSGFTGFGDMLNPKHPLQISSLNLATTNLDSRECEKVKNILKGLGSKDVREIMGKKEEKQQAPALSASALPALGDPNVRQALESLQSLIKGEQIQ